MLLFHIVFAFVFVFMFLLKTYLQMCDPTEACLNRQATSVSFPRQASTSIADDSCFCIASQSTKKKSFEVFFNQNQSKWLDLSLAGRFSGFCLELLWSVLPWSRSSGWRPRRGTGTTTATAAMSQQVFNKRFSQVKEVSGGWVVKSSKCSNVSSPFCNEGY